MTKRVILIVLDSVGIGELPDAGEYGDIGSNTVGNIYQNSKDFNLKNMEDLGLGNISGLEKINKAKTNYIGTVARCVEASKGKDTTTGHWEISGVILDKPFPVFPNGFPADFINEFEKNIGRKTIGNIVASGTEIINVLGQEHIETGSVIVYTSADSVLQIAAHEDIVPLEEQYDICRIARKMMHGNLNVGRVIARPFEGQIGNFTRTKNRRDFSVVPVSDTMLDFIKNSGKEVLAIGKIEDIFAQKGITKSIHTTDNPSGIDATIKAVKDDFEGLIFTNLVDFDMIYGHRNNIEGYGEALKYFDSKLPEIMGVMKDDDVLIITADHGCDPTTDSTDHSREYIPFIIYGKEIKPNNNLGTMDTFACIGKTILDLLNINNNIKGYSVKNKILK